MPPRSHSPDQIDTLSFEDVGIRWTVRTGDGERVRFVQLSELQDALDAGELTDSAELTFDGAIWRRLSDIPDLRAYFWQVWKRAQRGEIQSSWMPTIGLDSPIGDDSPTTIAPPDSDLSRAIQESLARELMARSQAKLLPTPEPEPTPESEPAPAPPPRPMAPPPSDVPGALRAMGLSLTLCVIAIGLLLSLP